MDTPLPSRFLLYSQTWNLIHFQGLATAQANARIGSGPARHAQIDRFWQQGGIFMSLRGPQGSGLDGIYYCVLLLRGQMHNVYNTRRINSEPPVCPRKKVEPRHFLHTFWNFHFFFQNKKIELFIWSTSCTIWSMTLSGSWPSRTLLLLLLLSANSIIQEARHLRL